MKKQSSPILFYWWPLAYFFFILLAIFLCKFFLGEYPFNVSEFLLGIYTSYNLFFNEITAGLLLFIFAVHPLIISSLLCFYQHRRLAPSHPQFSLTKNPRVRLYFASIIALCYFINLVPTFSCHNALCDFVPAISSFPGIFLSLSLVQSFTNFLINNFPWFTLDLRFLLTLPNALIIFFLVFYHLTPRSSLPKILRPKKVIIAIFIILTLLFLGGIAHYLLSKFYRLSNDELRSLMNTHAPDVALDDFTFELGDVIIERPHGDPEGLVSELSGTNLAHTEIYCGENEVVSASGMNQINTSGIMVEAFDWHGRRVRGALPASIVLRRSNAEQQNEQLCQQLRQIADDDSYTFGLDLLGNRQHFNCSNILIHQLAPDNSTDFNFITPDYVFIYLLNHGWQIVNWYN
jgi:hypothetical protein